MVKYHMSPEGLKRCVEKRGKCPYGGPVRFVSSDSLVVVPVSEAEYGVGFETRDEARKASQREVRKRKRKEVVEKATQWREDTYEQLKEKARLSFNEKELVRASERLYAYDDGKKQDKQVNNDLLFLRKVDPEVFKELGEYVSYLSSSGEKKALIKSYVKFYKEHPGQEFTGWPEPRESLWQEEFVERGGFKKDNKKILEEVAAGDEVLGEQFKYLLSQCKPGEEGALCAQLVGIHSAHSELGRGSITLALEKRFVKERGEAILREKMSLEEQEKLMASEERVKRAEERVAKLEEKIKRIAEKSSQARFQKLADKLCSLFRRIAVKREALIDGSVGSGKKLEEDSVVGGEWVFYKGSYYRMREPSEANVLEVFFTLKQAEQEDFYKRQVVGVEARKAGEKQERKRRAREEREMKDFEQYYTLS